MFTEPDGKKHNRFFGNLFCRVRGAKARRKEMRRLDTGEIEAIARELNLSRAELGALAFQPSGSLWSLERRLSHAGLSEEALAASHGDVLRDLRRVCSQCQSKARCARDLKHERRATPAKYCPNEQTLRALADESRPSRSRILPFPATRN
jgi:hypothetical protein